VAGGRPVSAVAAALGVSRPHLSSRQRTAPRRRGRPPLPDAGLVAAIQTLIADLPTYGYRRVHALLRRQAEREGRPAPNVKRVYRVMKVHGFLLQRHAGGEERRHEGRIAVDARNTRWCSDGLEIGCDNGERVRVAFALDCCDRQAMSFVAPPRQRAMLDFAMKVSQRAQEVREADSGILREHGFSDDDIWGHRGHIGFLRNVEPSRQLHQPAPK
jgi:transposase InsO family protein